MVSFKYAKYSWLFFFLASKGKITADTDFISAVACERWLRISSPGSTSSTLLPCRCSAHPLDHYPASSPTPKLSAVSKRETLEIATFRSATNLLYMQFNPEIKKRSHRAHGIDVGLNVCSASNQSKLCIHCSIWFIPQEMPADSLHSYVTLMVLSQSHHVGNPYTIYSSNFHSE